MLGKRKHAAKPQGYAAASSRQYRGEISEGLCALDKKIGLAEMFGKKKLPGVRKYLRLLCKVLNINLETPSVSNKRQPGETEDAWKARKANNEKLRKREEAARWHAIAGSLLPVVPNTGKGVSRKPILAALLESGPVEKMQAAVAPIFAVQQDALMILANLASAAAVI